MNKQIKEQNIQVLLTFLIVNLASIQYTVIPRIKSAAFIKRLTLQV